MALKLYKTVFWISFSIMLIGVAKAANDIRNNLKEPTIDQILLSRVKAESPFYSVPLVAPIHDDDKLSIKYDFENNPIRSFFYYENGNLSYILFFIGQFLTLLLLRKWFAWLRAAN